MLLSAALVVGTASVSGATPSASTLPANNSLYIIDQNSGDFYEVTADGAETLLNLQKSDTYYVPSGALNPVSKIAYYVGEGESDNQNFL